MPESNTMLGVISHILEDSNKTFELLSVPSALDNGAKETTDVGLNVGQIVFSMLMVSVIGGTDVFKSKLLNVVSNIESIEEES